MMKTTKTTNKFYKIKKIAMIFALLVLTLFLSATLYSCDKPDIYVLIENILQNKNLNEKSPDGLYSFTSELDIKINTDYMRNVGLLPDFDEKNEELDAVPGELNFKIGGRGKNSKKGVSQFIIDFELALPENENLKTTVYKKDNLLYFELNDVSRMVLDLMFSSGFLEMPVKDLFDEQIEYDGGSIICFDLKGFDLKFFNDYVKEIKKMFTVKSNVKYDFSNAVKDFDVPDFDKEKTVYFDDIKIKIKQGLLKLPYYRYVELHVVIETVEPDKTDKNTNNFMHILAIHENGKVDILEKVKLDCDLSKIWEDPDFLYAANIIPMRYLFELFGETVHWDSEKNQAYTTKENRKIIFTGPVINSKTYISLLQLLANTNYAIDSVHVEDYIEFVISRK